MIFNNQLQLPLLDQKEVKGLANALNQTQRHFRKLVLNNVKSPDAIIFKIFVNAINRFGSQIAELEVNSCIIRTRDLYQVLMLMPNLEKIHLSNLQGLSTHDFRVSWANIIEMPKLREMKLDCDFTMQQLFKRLSCNKLETFGSYFYSDMYQIMKTGTNNLRTIKSLSIEMPFKGPVPLPMEIFQLHHLKLQYRNNSKRKADLNPWLICLLSSQLDLRSLVIVNHCIAFNVLKQITMLRHLESLEIDIDNIPCYQLEVLSTMINLKSLHVNLKREDFGPEILNVLSRNHMPNLERLGFFAHEVSCDALNDFGKNLPNLTSLSIDVERAPSVIFKIITWRFLKLKSLSLWNRSLPVSLGYHLLKNEDIKELRLHGKYSFDDDGFQRFLSAFPNVEKFELCVSEIGYANFVSIMMLKTLRNLHLGSGVYRPRLLDVLSLMILRPKLEEIKIDDEKGRSLSFSSDIIGNLKIIDRKSLKIIRIY